MSKLFSSRKESEGKGSHESDTHYGLIKQLSSKVLGESISGFDLNKMLASIDEHAKKFPFLKDVEKNFGVKPSYIALAGFSLMCFSLIFGWGAALICNLVGFAYPAYQSFKAVESQSTDETKLWLTYWVVFSLFFFIEYLIDIILFWVPFYYLMKLLFLLYLYMPQLRGAETVYNYIIRPILLKHEKTIDDTVHKISQTATNRLTKLTGNLTEKMAKEGIRKRNVEPSR
ncbi:protein YOP1, putative [Hepatocystis sp. ex Piliocolobus tephrosceles]|nr:protein YOP1, putative [Hepatocystis sp. ex Piliocolobus tephrosceles]